MVGFVGRRARLVRVPRRVGISVGGLAGGQGRFFIRCVQCPASSRTTSLANLPVTEVGSLRACGCTYLSDSTGPGSSVSNAFVSRLSSSSRMSDRLRVGREGRCLGLFLSGLSRQRQLVLVLQFKLGNSSYFDLRRIKRRVKLAERQIERVRAGTVQGLHSVGNVSDLRSCVGLWSYFYKFVCCFLEEILGVGWPYARARLGVPKIGAWLRS